jgi:hypothetical protein
MSLLLSWKNPLTSSMRSRSGGRVCESLVSSLVVLTGVLCTGEGVGGAVGATVEPVAYLRRFTSLAARIAASSRPN